MVQLLLIVPLVFLSQLSFAVEQEVYADAKGSWFFIYPEENHWLVDIVSMDKLQWPRLDSRKVFAGEAQARAHLKQLSQGRQMIRSVDLPGEGLALSSPRSAPLWKVTQQWDWNWEIKFSQWVKAELDFNWWKRHNLPTDCADVLYSARWIFARNNGLPMTNHLASGNWFTENSVKPEWDNLPTAPEWDKDQRFLAALNYFLDLTYTHTLWRDSYPVAINASALLPGGHHLHLDKQTGHTQFLYIVGTKSDEVPVLTLNSTVPRDLRDMLEFVFFEPTANANGNGFMRVRWPSTENGAPALLPAAQMPHYSLEQFDPNFGNGGKFWEEVFRRINPSADYNIIGKKILQQILDSFRLRITVVEKGYQVCSAKPCAVGSPEWEAWSTPTRDERIEYVVHNFDQLSNRITDWWEISQTMRITVLTLNGNSYTLGDLIKNWRIQRFSSDPNDSIPVRWGL